MYAIRSYYADFNQDFTAAIEQLAGDDAVKGVIVTSGKNRITSYNVCYTKLLRINLRRSFPQKKSIILTATIIMIIIVQTSRCA